MSTTALQINDTLTGGVMNGLGAAGNVLAQYAQNRADAKAEAAESQSWEQYAAVLEGQLNEAVTELDRRKAVIEKLESYQKFADASEARSGKYITYLQRRFVLLENAFNRQSANVAAQAEIRALLEEEVMRLTDPSRFTALDPVVAEERMRAAWDKFMTTSSVTTDLSKPIRTQLEELKGGVKVPVVEAMVTPAARLKT